MLWRSWWLLIFLYQDLNSGYIQNSNFLNNCELTKGEKGDFIAKEFEVYKVEFVEKNIIYGKNY